MANFHVDTGLAGTQQAMTTTYKTLIEGLAQTTGIKRTRWYQFNAGPAGLPSSTDCDLVFDISRITGTGTGTAATPLPLDPNEGAATSSWKINDTVEGTITATSSVKYLAGNQRSAWSWQTNDMSQMLVGPATNNAGLAARGKSSTMTTAVGASCEFNE